MSQAGGGALAKGLIEITGNVAPLEASLAKAEGQVTASLGRMQAQVQGAGGGAPGAGPGGAAATGQAAAAAGQLNQQLGGTEAKAKAAGAGMMGLTATMNTATAGFRGIVGAVQSTIGAITAALGWIGLITTAITFLIEKMRERGRLEAEAGQTRLRLAQESAKLDSQSLVDRTQGLAKEIKMLDDAYQSRVDAINKIYGEELAAAEKVHDALKRIRRDEAKERASNSLSLANEQYGQELKLITRNHEEAVKNAEKSEQKKNRDIEKSLMTDRQRVEADYQDKVDDVQEAMRKNAGNKDAAQMNKIHQQRLQLLQRERDKQIADIDERERKDRETSAETAAQKAEQARREAQAFADAQRAAFNQLRTDINGLFNTNQLEVGIGRLGQLMEVLIAKTGTER